MEEAEARERVTTIVAGWGGEGTPGRAALDAQVPNLCGQLRRMAQRRLGGGDQTLQATALGYEACLKLVDQSRVDWKGRTHFKAVAAGVMRNVLVDHVRERGAPYVRRPVRCSGSLERTSQTPSHPGRVSLSAFSG
jgi:DNA-directed RNA polymerase specialized sigma24 family protein